MSGSFPDEPAEFDGPWQEALDLFFEPFVAFFFPEVHREIDWGRGHEFLEKEPTPGQATATRLSARWAENPGFFQLI